MSGIYKTTTLLLVFYIILLYFDVNGAPEPNSCYKYISDLDSINFAGLLITLIINFDHCHLQQFQIGGNLGKILIIISDLRLCC